MKKIILYVKNYFLTVDKRVLGLSTLLIAFAVFCNYHFHVNRHIVHLKDPYQYIAWYGVFLLAFFLPYALYSLFGLHQLSRHRHFFTLLLIAPIIFSWKMVYDIDIPIAVAPEAKIFWNTVIYYPFKLLFIGFLLRLIWKWDHKDESFYGISIKGFNARPYLYMLLIMLPLIAAASTQSDFLAVYPKLQHLSFFEGHNRSGWYKLLYELSYGSDFISIELFFRGFLVLAFVKWFGRDAILPMACFYCTIHFGKPMGECISSFFGGLILGIVTYHTRTIFGGLMVHLGIAWLMELGGYLGHLYG
jgi:hypothetical protein